MIYRTPFELLEDRRLFTFAVVDASFNGGAVVANGAVGERDGNDGLFAGGVSATVLADGRVMTQSGADVRYYRGDGSLDVKRGRNAKGGIFRLSNGGGVNIDEATGEFYWNRGASSDGTVVQRYDDLGRLARTYRFLPGQGIIGGTVQPLSDGTFLQAVRVDQIDSNTDLKTVGVRLYKYDASAAQITSFGTGGEGGGVLATPLSFSSDARDRFDIARVDVDRLGRIYVSFVVADQQPDGLREITYSARIARFNANGQPDTSYGTNGIATVYEKSGNVAPLKFVFDAETGASYALIPTLENVQSKLMLFRTNSSGVTSTQQVGRTKGQRAIHLDGALAVADDGSVYVASRLNGGATQVFRYVVKNHTTLSLDDGWSDFGDSRQTTTVFEPDDLAIDDKTGRLFVTGYAQGADSNRDFGTYVLKGTSTFSKYDAGTVTRLSDGTILVKGTAGDDQISVVRKQLDIVVTLGGRTKRYADAKVDGLLIQAGRGDDEVTVSRVGVGAYIQGGGGDDTLRGAAGYGRGEIGADTILGNDGNDQIEGGDGEDQLYGQAGNDVLLGGNDGDELFGGAGNDRLYASGLARDLTSDDRSRDLLDGGTGRDFMRRDVGSGNTDILGRIDATDTVTGG